MKKIGDAIEEAMDAVDKVITDVELRPEDIHKALGCKSIAELEGRLIDGRYEPRDVDQALADLRAMALQGLIPHGRVIYASVTVPTRDPAAVAFEETNIERDMAIPKEDIRAMLDAGIHEIFRKGVEARQDLYMHEAGCGFQWAMWAALNDLCADTSNLGRFSRRIRALRVKAVLQNCAVTGRPAPKVGR
jgi:hypothetical protein